MRRKCEDVSAKTIAAYKHAIEEYGSMSAEDLVAVAANVLMNIAILPLERMSDRPLQMRNAMARHFAKLIKMGSEYDG